MKITLRLKWVESDNKWNFMQGEYARWETLNCAWLNALVFSIGGKLDKTKVNLIELPEIVWKGYET